MKQNELKESIKALKACIYLIENESYRAFKSETFISDVYYKSDEDRISSMKSDDYQGLVGYNTLKFYLNGKFDMIVKKAF